MRLCGIHHYHFSETIFPLWQNHTHLPQRIFFWRIEVGKDWRWCENVLEGLEGILTGVGPKRIISLQVSARRGLKIFQNFFIISRQEFEIPKSPCASFKQEGGFQSNMQYIFWGSIFVPRAIIPGYLTSGTWHSHFLIPQCDLAFFNALSTVLTGFWFQRNS